MRRVVSLYRRAYSGLPREVWLLAVVVLVHRSGTMVLPFLALYLTQKLGLTAGETGFVLALYGLGAIAGAQLGGWLTDRIGPLSAQTLSFFTSGAALLALGFVESRGWLELAVMMASLTSEGHRPANAAALAAFTNPGNHFRAFAVRRLAVNLGMTLGPATGGFLASIDYLWLFLVNGGMCLVSGVLMVWVVARGHLRIDPSVDDDAGGSESARRSPWRDRVYLQLMFLITLVSILFLQLLSTYPLTLREKLEHPEPVIGLIFAVNTAVIVIFEMALIELVGRFAPLRVAAAGLLAFSLGFGFLPLVQGLGWLVATVLLWTLGEMLTLPLFEGVAASLAPKSARGAYLGLYTATFSVALVVAPLLGGWIYQDLGWKILWFGCGGLFIVLALIFWVFASKVRPVESDR